MTEVRIPVVCPSCGTAIGESRIGVDYLPFLSGVVVEQDHECVGRWAS